jgi:hypothetical protein
MCRIEEEGSGRGSNSQAPVGEGGPWACDQAPPFLTVLRLLAEPVQACGESRFF